VWGGGRLQAVCTLKRLGDNANILAPKIKTPKLSTSVTLHLKYKTQTKH